MTICTKTFLGFLTLAWLSLLVLAGLVAGSIVIDFFPTDSMLYSSVVESGIEREVNFFIGFCTAIGFCTVFLFLYLIESCP